MLHPALFVSASIALLNWILRHSV